MKKVIPLSLMCLLLVGIGQVRAQTAEQPLGFKLGFGLAGYQGDLGNTMLQFPEDNFMWTMGLSYYINKHLGLALGFNFFTLRKKNGPHDSVIKKRNTHFKTSLINMDLLLRIKPFVTRLNPYIAIGLGGSFTRDISNFRNNEYRSNFIFTLPVGIGVNYKISDQFSFNMQMLYNWAFTDDIIDDYPMSARKAVYGLPNVPHPNIDRKSSDRFLLTTAGIVFNFGGGKSPSMEEKLLRQSMKNLKAAQNASNMAANNLNQAQKLNRKTLEALNKLENAMNMNKHQANELKSKFVHIINNIQFAFDKSSLLPTAKTELGSLADIMNHYPGLEVNIAGHTDDRGTDEYNKHLSQRRVQTAKQFLLNHGVDPSQITTEAYGETKPLVTHSNPADIQTTYAQNRSVQLTLGYHNPHSK